MKIISHFVILFSLLLLIFTSCGSSAILPDENGIANATINETMRSTDRDFEVLSAKKVTEFDDYTPLSGEQLIDVTIKTTNRSKAPLTIYDMDYQIQWGNSGFSDPLAPLANSNMAPFETVLQKNETVEFHYLYSVPQYTANFSLCFLDPTTESLFYCDFSI